MELAIRNIYLYGDLGEKFGKIHKLAVSSIGEAIRAMEANFPGFKSHIKKEGQYQVCRGEVLAETEADLEKTEQLNEETVKMNFQTGDFHIAPVIEGADRNGKGWFQIILGIILIVVGAVLTAYGVGGPIGGYLINLGIGLVLSGLGTLLTPTPENPTTVEPDRPAENRSFLFNGPVNTMEQGGVIPLVYGRFTKGSTVLSAALQAEDI